MNRREALKVASAGAVSLVLPSWLIRPVKRRTVDLLQFCGEDRSGYYFLKQPFEQDDWTYATDGRICVKVEPQNGDLRETEKRLPPASSLGWWDHDKLMGWRRWPTKVRMASTMTDCPNAEIESETGIQWCLSSCELCHGRGVVARPNVVCLDGNYLDSKFFAKATTLPGLEYRMPVRDSEPVRLRFDGGDGLLLMMDRANVERDIAFAAKF